MSTDILDKPNIYIPPFSSTLESASMAQIRLAIQGFGGEGKTYAAMTFPNPVVLNLNKGLGAHRGRKEITEIKITDPTFAKNYYPNEPTNIKEVTIAWLRKEALKLTSNQTLVFDGSSDIETAYHIDWKDHPVISSRSGKVDDFAEWGLKLSYFGEITSIFKKCQCNVVWISHEAEKKDKGTGEYTGKIRPLMSGQFADKILGEFTDWVRQLSCNKPNFNSITDAQKKNISDNWGMTVDEFKSMCDTFPRNTIYYWQLESDDIFSGKTSSLVNFPRFIPANYQSFLKYLRK